MLLLLLLIQQSGLEFGIGVGDIRALAVATAALVEARIWN
jgi:hypothetical protein